MIYLFLFGTVVVVGVTVVTVASLSYVKWLDSPDPPDPNADRCPALNVWTGSSPKNEGIKYPYRCTLAAGHDGPHRIDHPMPGNKSDRDYWWKDKAVDTEPTPPVEG